MKIIHTALCSFGMSGKLFHAPFIHTHPGFRLYGVVERTKNLAAEIYPDIKTFKSLDEMLADHKIDLVIVNTPNDTHYDFTKRAILAGKNVIVEKPFTIEVQEAEELIALASEKKIKLSVYHNRRYDSGFLTIRKILNENLLGRIVEAEFHFDRFKETLNTKAHKEEKKKGNGTFYDLGSHLVDQAIQLFGMPKAVFADIDIMREISQVEDYFELILFYPRMRVRLKSTYVAREPLPGYVLHGLKGSFQKHAADVQETALQQGILPDTEDWGTEPESKEGLIHTEVNGQIIRQKVKTERGNYMHYFEGIHNAIVFDEPLPVTGEEGLKVILIIDAAYKSRDLKSVVSL